ncbi:MAG: LamG domain-containing protein [Nanoarchaeota archaeon]
MKNMLLRGKKKRGISVMIGYILLISFVVIISVFVYRWVKTYVPKDVVDCPDDVSFSIEEAKCIGGNLNLTIKNNGKFNVAGYSVYGTNISISEAPTIDLSGDVISGGSKFTKYVVPRISNENLFEIDDEVRTIFKVHTDISSVEITPFRFQEQNNRRKVVHCGNSRVKKEVICKTQLNITEISGLISWWKFDGNSNDTMGRNNGTVIGGAVWNATGGKFGGAYEFDGSNYIFIESSPSLNFSTTNSVMASIWIKPTDSTPNQGTFLRNRNTEGSGNVRLRYESDYGGNCGLYMIDAFGNTCGGGVLPNQWTHIATMINPTSTAVYVNGILSNSKNQSSFISPLDFNLTFGEHFNGTIDEIMIFNKSLTNIEIGKLYTHDYYY